MSNTKPIKEESDDEPNFVKIESAGNDRNAKLENDDGDSAYWQLRDFVKSRTLAGKPTNARVQPTT